MIRRWRRAPTHCTTSVIDAGIGCWDGKYTYLAIRPFQLDPEVKPLFPTPNHPSYPAAHGCFSMAQAGILGYLFPRDAAALAALAEEAAESRVWAGIHYRSDIVAGAALGRAVAAKVIGRAGASLGDRTEIVGRRRPAGHLLRARRDLLAALRQGADNRGQHHLQQLAHGRRLARQLAVPPKRASSAAIGRRYCPCSSCPVGDAIFD